MEVFVFDLDFTIWNAGDTWCSETNPPYFWDKGKLFDQSGRWIRLYPEVQDILEKLKSMNILVAIASRTHEPEKAIQLLQLFDIGKYFDIKEIYPGSKITHLKKIREQTRCPFDQIVFFDDEDRNIEDAKSLGIISVLINNGITLAKVEGFLA